MLSNANAKQLSSKKGFRVKDGRKNGEKGGSGTKGGNRRQCGKKILKIVTSRAWCSFAAGSQ